MSARFRGVGAAVAFIVLLGSCSRGTPPASREGAAQHEVHGLADESPAPPTLAEIGAAAKRLGDLEQAARISRVRLIGTIEFPATGGRLPIEEVGSWPDRYEMRLRGTPGVPPVISLSGTTLRLHLPAGWPPSFGLGESFARLRLRSLFVLRHVAAALADHGTVLESRHSTAGSVALAARDRYGEFGIVWGGVQGRMLAIEEGRAFTHYPAFLRTGQWFLPAMQSYEADGVLVAVVHVTSVETESER